MIVAAMLRGVNLGAHHRIRMEPLRALYEAQGLRDVQTLLQSGNVVFQTTARDLEKLRAKLEIAFEAGFGFPAATFLRSGPELRAVVEACPFAARPNLDPSKLAVLFLQERLDPSARARLAAITDVAEELHPAERELYIYYHSGMARPQLTTAMLDRALGRVPTTVRNWNTTNKLAALARG
jgi:uncharacterized protein (DUF1697 family)